MAQVSGTALGRSIKNHGLQRGDLDGFAAARIQAAQLIIETDTIVAGFGKTGPIALIRARREGGLLRAPPPSDWILQSLATFGAVDLGRHHFIFFVKEISLFHRFVLFLKEMNDTRAPSQTAKPPAATQDTIPFSGVLEGPAQ
jgi:hypothetical protein